MKSTKSFVGKLCMWNYTGIPMEMNFETASYSILFKFWIEHKLVWNRNSIFSKFETNFVQFHFENDFCLKDFRSTSYCYVSLINLTRNKAHFLSSVNFYIWWKQSDAWIVIWYLYLLWNNFFKFQINSNFRPNKIDFSFCFRHFNWMQPLIMYDLCGKCWFY